MERQMASSTPSSARNGRRSRSNREDTAKAIVAEQISQAVQSTSNLLHLIQHSSSSQAQLMKLPKNLLAKSSTMKKTGQVLEQMPRLISSLDAHMENGLESLPHLRTVTQLLTNMESCQLYFPSNAHLPQEEIELSNQPPELG